MPSKAPSLLAWPPAPPPPPPGLSTSSPPKEVYGAPAASWLGSVYSWEKRAESAPNLYLWKARKDRPAFFFLGTEGIGQKVDDRKAKMGERCGGMIRGGSGDAAVLERRRGGEQREREREGNID